MDHQEVVDSALEPRSGRAEEADEETWAFEILRQHLVARGHVVDRVRRPDVANRLRRDVDFLIEFDGREVAIEVTRLDQERQWWVLLGRLQRGVLAQLGEWSPMAPGLNVELTLLRLGSYAEIDSSALAIAVLAREWSRDPKRSKERVAAGLVEVELDPRRSPGLTIFRKTAAHDPWLDPRADKFVEKLVVSKGSQGLDYAELWLLVIDMDVIIGLDLIEAGFAKAGTEVPPNWKRVYLLPASNRRDVECLMLGS